MIPRDTHEPLRILRFATNSRFVAKGGLKRLLKPGAKNVDSAVVTRWVCASIAAWVAILALGGCIPNTRETLVFDLVKDFPFADVFLETDEIDFGEPDARVHLVEGWSWDEKFDSTSFIWGIGERSSLWFYLHRARPLTLTLTCWSPPFRDDRRQRVRVLVNDALVDELELNEQRREYRISVQAPDLRTGRNEIEFQYTRTGRDREFVPGSTGIRPLAAAWDSVRIEGASLGEQPQALSEDGVPILRVPAKTEIHYHLKAKPGDVINIGGVEVDGPRGEESRLMLELGITGDEPTFSRKFDASPNGKPLSIAIPVAREQIVRISLAARETGDGAQERASLRLVRPTVLGTATQAPPKSDRGADLRRSRRPNVVLYVVDTLRADHLGPYGYTRPTSPNLDSLAREAIVFTNAHAQTSWTRPAVASILTGLSPDAHGVDERDEAMADSTITLAEILSGVGYSTAGFVTNGNVTKNFGFDQGFEVFRFAEEENAEEQAKYADIGDWLVRKASDWLGHRADDRPFFLYLHAIHPHGPYTPSEVHRKHFAEGILDPKLGSLEVLKQLETFQYEGPDPRDTLVSLYDAEIAWDDERMGEFIDHLKRLDLWNDTLFVFLSDHGEEFFEHGWSEHGRSLNVEQLNIPLVVKLPHGAWAGTRSSYLAQQVDVVPTILWYLEVPLENPLEGMSLLPQSLENTNEPRHSPIFATLNLDQRVARGVMIDDLKLIHTVAYDQPKPQFELFNVSTDPQEAFNLARTRPVAVGYLNRLLREREDAIAGRSPQASKQGTMSAEVEKNLRALGYIQ